MAQVPEKDKGDRNREPRTVGDQRKQQQVDGKKNQGWSERYTREDGCSKDDGNRKGQRYQVGKSAHERKYLNRDRNLRNQAGADDQGFHAFHECLREESPWEDTAQK